MRYPGCEVVDIYKLLYQAANGPKHFAIDFDINESKRDWNNAISENISPLESISVDGELVRVHFGPVRENGISFDEVINIFTMSVNYFQPRPELLIDWWRELGESIKSNILPLPYSQYAILDNEFRQWGFESRHHSESFVKAYKPAYLVILRKFIQPIIDSTK